MKSTTLNQHWTVRPQSPSHPYPRNQREAIPETPATVPGSVHLDLHQAGFIGHPFQERHEGGVQWVDETDWVYACEFEWHPTPELPYRVLKFHGLDTVATILLNGETTGTHDNFFLPLEIGVGANLVEGTNRLEVRFESAVKVGDRRRTAYFEANGIDPGTYNFDERAFVRKPGYMSGWDWGPRLVSCGIWRPVELLEFQSRIAAFSVRQRALGGGEFELTAEYTLVGDEEPTLTYNGMTLPQGQTTWTVTDSFWWPNGEGEQSLQTVELALPSGDRWVKKIGLRTIELVRQADEVGTSFEFLVNGRRLWSCGANWIPNDSFPGRITDKQYTDAIQRYALLGMNMLRVWGGGLYETDAFYDACDEAGILVWQDFPYACSYYPDDAPHREMAAREAAFHVHRLKDRTSLALWCGNNENRSMWYAKWGGPDRSPQRFYGAPIYDETLKDVVTKYDPSRPYIESSPVVVNGMEGVVNATRHSDDHYWDVWHGRGDWRYYKESETRFSSEFGFASSCSMDAWRAVSNREMGILDPTVRSHDKTNKPWEIFEGMVLQHYPKSESLEDWIYTSQLNQRDAMRAALEHYRSGEACRGALIWQVNDCWPVQSWALEDYHRLLKPAGWEIARLYAGVLLCADGVDGNLKVTIANDREAPLKDVLILEAIETTSGKVLASGQFEVDIPAQSRSLAAEWPLEAFDSGTVVLRCRLQGAEVGERWVLLAEPKEMKAVPIELTARVEGDVLTVSGEGLVLDLVVWNDEDPKALADPETGLVGFRAHSAVNPKVRLRVGRPLGTLRARSLAGWHSVRR